MIKRVVRPMLWFESFRLLGFLRSTNSAILSTLSLLTRQNANSSRSCAANGVLRRSFAGARSLILIRVLTHASLPSNQ